MWNGVMWKSCFSASQNAKNESQPKHRNQVRNRLYWNLGLRVWRIILVITWGAHKRQTFTLTSTKLMWIFFLFTRNRVFKHKEVVSKLHVCCNGLGKMWASYIFHFFTKNSNPTHMKKFNIFLHNICRHDLHSLFRSR